MSSFLWFPINALQAIFTLLWSASLVLVALVVRWVTGETKIPLAMARRCWAPALLFAGGMRLRVSGLENIDPSETYFFAANHQSIVDVLATYRALPVPLLFITQERLRRVPFLGWYMAAMGMIFIRLDNRRRSFVELEHCRERLSTGHSILLFPEGSRSRDGRIGELKPGSVIPAIDTGASVVPVFLDGPGQILPPGTFSVRPGKIRVVVGRPILTAGLEREDRRELARQVREQLVVLSRAAESQSPAAS